MWGNVNLVGSFMTGLLAGGLSCMAVQGGFLATALAKREFEHLKDKAAKAGKILPILSFLSAKLIAYTILGAFLGWMGERMQLTLQVQIGLQILVGVFMAGTALNMLEAHPIFRYFAIQPPRFLARIVRKQSKSIPASQGGKDVFAPAFLGAFTIFIPCGVTQAMMVLAIGTANPFLGSAVMFAFVLGTTPVFFILGYLTMKLGDVLQKRFVKVASAIIIALAIFTFNNAIALTGSYWTVQNLSRDIYCVVSYCGDNVAGGIQLTPVTEETIVFREDGYSPTTFAVKAGSLVTLHLKNESGGGCVQAFTIPALNIQKVVPLRGSETITFTAPKNAGKISFMCSMGMYNGVIEVI